MNQAEPKIGGTVLLLSDIYDDGEDHHPPGYIASSGEIVIVRRIVHTSADELPILAVSHENITDLAFVVYPNEYEVIQEQTEIQFTHAGEHSND